KCGYDCFQAALDKLPDRIRQNMGDWIFTSGEGCAGNGPDSTECLATIRLCNRTTHELYPPGSEALSEHFTCCGDPVARPDPRRPAGPWAWFRGAWWPRLLGRADGRDTGPHP